MTVAVGILIVVFVVVMIVAKVHDDRSGVTSAKQRAASHRIAQQAARQAEMTCPHCQTRGEVRTKPVKVKQGISGGKATGAVLTGGFSLLATGLSRKVSLTEARCAHCGASWKF